MRTDDIAGTYRWGRPGVWGIYYGLMVILDEMDTKSCGVYPLMVFQACMLWLEGPTHSLLHIWTLVLEHLASWLCFEVEIALYDDYTLQSHGALPCLHIWRHFSWIKAIYHWIVVVAHVWKMLGSLMTWPLVYVVYSMLVNLSSWDPLHLPWSMDYYYNLSHTCHLEGFIAILLKVG